MADNLPAAPIRTVDAVVDNDTKREDILYGRRWKSAATTVVQADFADLERQVMAHMAAMQAFGTFEEKRPKGAVGPILVTHDETAFHIQLTDADINSIIQTFT